MCPACGRSRPLGDAVAEGWWRCRCGGLLDLVGPPADPLAAGGAALGAAPGGTSPLARYAVALPPGAAAADLGLAVTPLQEAAPGVFVKADYRHPTGSFKDRGAAVMIGAAAAAGVRSVVADSSGNAGRAVAAHARRAGLACTVYVPEGTAPAKVAAIADHGADVAVVAGGRAAAAAAAQAQAGAPGDRAGRWYASHVHQPLFHHGVKTLAFELFEQLPGLSGATVVVPAGNGTLVLGLWIGFAELVARGRMARPPAIVAVQAAACAPLAGHPPDLRASPATAATGIAVPDPRRATQIRAAVLASGGSVVTVGEAAVEQARRDLAGRGHGVEPTGAVAWAATSALAGTGPPPGGRPPVVAVLTGGAGPVPEPPVSRG